MRFAAVTLGVLLSCTPSPPPKTTARPAVAPPVTEREVLAPLEGRAVTQLASGPTMDPIDFAWSPGGAVLAVEQDGQRVGLWDVEKGARTASLPAPGTVHSLRFSVDGHTVWVVASHGAAAFDAASGDCLRFARATSRRTAARARFGGAGRGILATIGIDGAVRAIDVATGELRWEVAAGELATFDPAVTAADRIAVRSGGETVVRQLESGAIVATVRSPKPGGRAHLAPDARSTVFVAPDRRSYVLADVTGNEVRYRGTIRGNTVYVSGMIPHAERPRPGDGSPAEVIDVTFSPDGRQVVVTYDPPNSTYTLAGKQLEASLIDIASAKPRQLPGTVSGRPRFGHGSRRIIARGRPWTDEVVVFDVASNKRQVRSMPEAQFHEALLGPGDRLAYKWHHVHVADMTGATLFEVPVASALDPSSSLVPRPTMDVALGDDLKRVIFGGALGPRDAPTYQVSGMVVRWDARAGQVRTRPMKGHPRQLSWLRAKQAVALVEKAHSGARRFALRGDELDVTWSSSLVGDAYVASPDGRLIALSLYDAVQVVDSTTGEVKATLADQPIHAVAFDPKSELLAIRAYGRDVRVFAADGSARLATIDVQADTVWFLPDGTLVLEQGGKLAHYDARSGTRTRMIVGPSSSVAGVSGDGTVVMYGDGSIVEARTGTVRSRVRADVQMVLSPDGERIALADAATGLVSVHATRGGAVVHRLLTPVGTQLGRFSVDHEWLALRTLTGVQLVRDEDGASVELGLVAVKSAAGATEVGHAIWLSSGHFEADDIAAGHLRTWSSTGVTTDPNPFAHVAITPYIKWSRAPD